MTGKYSHTRLQPALTKYFDTMLTRDLFAVALTFLFVRTLT